MKRALTALLALILALALCPALTLAEVIHVIPIDPVDIESSAEPSATPDDLIDPDDIPAVLPVAPNIDTEPDLLPKSEPIPQSEFLCEENASGLTITGYTGTDTALTIPSAIDGLTVTAIAPAAFINQAELTSVTVPGTVSTVGSRAFSGCIELATVTVERGVSALGEGCFAGCVALSKLVLPRTVATFNAPFSATPLLTIYGFVGSPAYDYAVKNHIPFIKRDDAEDPADKVTLKFTLSSMNVMMGTAKTVPYTVSSASGAEYPIMWTSSAPAVVSIDAEGVMTPGAPGQASVTATVQGGDYPSASCDITVFERIDALRFAQDTLSIGTGQSADLRLFSEPSVSVWLYDQLRWQTDNPGCISVDKRGVIAALRTGTATLTAALIDDPSVKAKVKVSVYAFGQGVESVFLANRSVRIAVADELTLSASVYPKKAKDKRITWSSDNEGVATVSEDGVVTGLRNGLTTVFATASNGAQATCTVTVGDPVVPVDDAPVTKVKLDDAKLVLPHGATRVLSCTVQPAAAQGAKITWTTSNPYVALVGTDGRITGVGPGSATIKATAPSGKKASCRVTVTHKKITGIYFNESSLTYSIAASGPLPSKVLLSPTITTPSATNKQLKWTSSNKKVAAVSKSGVVTVLKKGKTTIKAAAQDGSRKKASYVLYVTE